MQHAPGTVFRVVPDDLARSRIYQRVAVHAYGGGGGGGVSGGNGYTAGGVSLGGGGGGGASYISPVSVTPGTVYRFTVGAGGASAPAAGAGGAGGSHAPHVYCGGGSGSCPCGLPGAHAAGP